MRASLHHKRYTRDGAYYVFEFASVYDTEIARQRQIENNPTRQAVV